MRRLLKNKFVVLLCAIIVLSIVYFGVNKAIKQYNFANVEELVIEENGDGSNAKDDKIDEIKDAEEEDFNEETDLVTGEEINESGGEENGADVWTSTSKIYVYITGEVNNPGVLTLSDGSRIVDAINAAGGTTSRANISKVNLVYVLEDGMKVNIPNESDLKNNPDFEYITMSSGDGGNDGISSAGERGDKNFNTTDSNVGGSKGGYDIGIVNINTATQTELETLPGIGPSTALKIINYRKENGKFSSIEEIKNVSGIGDNKFEEIKKYITV